MLKLGNFSVKCPGYKYVKKMFRVYNATDICQHWSKKDYIVASWDAGDDFMPAGYYYQSCYSTMQAAKKQAALITGKVFHRSQIIFCIASEF